MYLLPAFSIIRCLVHLLPVPSQIAQEKENLLRRHQRHSSITQTPLRHRSVLAQIVAQLELVRLLQTTQQTLEIFRPVVYQPQNETLVLFLVLSVTSYRLSRHFDDVVEKDLPEVLLDVLRLTKLQIFVQQIFQTLQEEAA